MALQRGKLKELPTDAVILTEQEAVLHQYKIINNWKDTSDTWVFKHGYTILSVMSAVTGIYINNHYRLKLRLREFGRLSSYIPCTVLPAIISAVFHQQFIVTEVVLNKNCPVCIQTRAASLQCLTGCIFPLLTGPLAALSLATRYMTYNIPPITSHPKAVFQMLYKFSKPIGNPILAILIAQGLAAATLTYQEQKAFLKIQTKLNKLEWKDAAEFDDRY